MSSENPQDNLKQTILISVLVSFVTALVVGFVSGGAGSFAFPYWLKTEIGRLSEQPIIKEIVKPSAPEAAVQTQEELIVKVVKDASPSVVSVIATKDLPVVEQYFGEPFGGDEFFRQFFPEFQVPQYRQKGTEKKNKSTIFSRQGNQLKQKEIRDGLVLLQVTTNNSNLEYSY